MQQAGQPTDAMDTALGLWVGKQSPLGSIHMASTHMEMHLKSGLRGASPSRFQSPHPPKFPRQFFVGPLSLPSFMGLCS